MSLPEFQTTITTGYPVDVPKPGQIVRHIMDRSTPLTVLRVEPMLVCRDPDGCEVTLYAHEVEIQDVLP